jgi:hypothetical protein
MSASYDGKKVDIYNCGVILFSCALRASPFYLTDSQDETHDMHNALWSINDDASANLYF